VLQPDSVNFAEEALAAVNYLSFHEAIFEAAPQLTVQSYMILISNPQEDEIGKNVDQASNLQFCL